MPGGPHDILRNLVKIDAGGKSITLVIPQKNGEKRYTLGLNKKGPSPQRKKLRRAEGKNIRILLSRKGAGGPDSIEGRRPVASRAGRTQTMGGGEKNVLALPNETV